MATENRSAWTRIALGLARGRSLTPVQLQKTVFLLQELVPNLVRADQYQFKPYKYGPFTVEVYKDAEQLADTGLATLAQDPSGYILYSASPKLVDAVEVTLGEAPNDIREFAERLASWTREQSFLQLVRAVYERFPAYRVNSVLGPKQ
ncbi:MAG: hypothetical protein K1X67_24605 [Fimbriimonadaceae bacterium]|nr:hypothetical protein [Fimbriimonadaceae bacterium]